MLAAEAYRPEVVKFLVEQGADVNARDEHGVTALHHAAGGPQDRSVLPPSWVVGARGTMHTLVASGAPLDARDSKGRTPLKLARARGLASVAAVLERLGAKE